MSVERMEFTEPRLEASGSQSLLMKGLFVLGPLLLGSIAARIGLSLPHRAQAWRHPAFWPPLWLFWSVWLLIYPCWGYATYLIWQRRHIVDVRGVLALFVSNLGSNLSFMPIAGLSGENPGVMTLGDLNGIFVSIVVAWLYRRYVPKTTWLMLPLLIWMPITFGLKAYYWSVNA